MKQLTIRGLGEELEECIRSLAEKEDISLNEAALRLLRRGAGLEQAAVAEDVNGRSLDDLAGNWSDEEAKLMDRVEHDFERIDPELWS